MELAVHQQQPTVRYGTDVPPAAVKGYFDSCLSIVNEMNVDNQFTTFGAAGADAAVRLPYTQQSS